ncbi:MAG: hypothetical protein ACPL7K_02910 [Armatimonadota bacterium]
MLLGVVISLWLIIIAILDIRRGEVSNWLTVPPLLAVVAWRMAIGEWYYLLLLALVLLIAEWPVTWPLGVAAVVGIQPYIVAQGIVAQGLESVTIIWLIVLALWGLNVLGGADVKAVMTLSALFPDARLGWLMMLCWWAFSLAMFIRRYGYSSPRVLLSDLVSIVSTGKAGHEGHRVPALPALAVAGLVFLWFRVLW